jgi:hypothetical protein
MYRWLLFPILSSEPIKLEVGSKWSELRKSLQAHHPVDEGLHPGNLTQAPASVASLQVEKNIKPIILDYDPSLLGNLPQLLSDDTPQSIFQSGR